MSSRTFIAGEDESAPGFKASKDRPNLLSGITAVSVFKLKPVLTYQLRNPRTFISVIFIFFSIIVYHRILNAVPCALLEDRVVYAS